MKYYIGIDLDNERFDFLDKYSIESNYCDSNNTIGVKVMTDLDESFNDLFSDCNVKKIVKDYNEFNFTYNNTYNFLTETFTNEKSNGDTYRVNNNTVLEIINNYDYISFIGELPIISEYIKKNNLQEKNIYISYGLDFSQKTYDDVIKYLGDVPNLYLTICGNMDYVSFKDFEKSLSIFNNYTNFIKSLELSPIEEIMCAYDIVKNKMYSEEEENEANELSRDLCKVLLGDRIVCLGFSRIFNELLEQLGYKSMVCSYDDIKNSNGGHARNFTYIKDDKYGIDGLYFFDVTWDSKKEDDEDFYINRYRCFLKSLNEIESLTPSNLVNRSFNANVFSDEVLENVNIIGLNELKSLNTLSNFLEEKELIDSQKVSMYYMNEMRGKSTKDILDESDKYEIKQFISKYKDKFNKRIDLKTFLKILYNVRIKEYYYNMTEKLDKENLIRSMLSSNFITKDFLLIAAIFDYNKEQKQRKLIHDSNEMIMKNKLDLGIKRVELTKTLKKVLEKKMND